MNCFIIIIVSILLSIAAINTVVWTVKEVPECIMEVLKELDETSQKSRLYKKEWEKTKREAVCEISCAVMIWVVSVASTYGLLKLLIFLGN